MDARPESDDKPETFRLTAHSAISGWMLADVVDRQGPGSGIGYVSTEPHTLYIRRIEWFGLDLLGGRGLSVAHHPANRPWLEL